MANRQILWDNIEKDILGKIKYGTSGSCMYREGDKACLVTEYART